MNKYDVIIIGGGASGLMASLQFANSNKKVLMVDAGYSLGKKILVTGNGRCNLTNLNMSSKYFNCNIDKFLSKFNQEKTIKYFNSLGLETLADECGRVYPITNSAKSVVDVLTKKLETISNVEVINNLFIEDIKIAENGYVITGKNNEFFAKNLIISNGNIDNKFLDKIKVEKIEKTPSLVALTTKENTKNLDGVRVNNVEIIAECCGVLKREVGELLFKDKGLSGIAIFNVSTLFARSKKFMGKIYVNLLPNKEHNEVVKLINDRCKLFKNVVDIFTGLFVDKIREELFKRLKINEQIKSEKLTKTTIEKLANLIQNLDFEVNGYYSNNQVISGGIDITKLTDNLESKKHKGLYFAGETINVDGECGGYNLQWAWISGYIVGNALK